MGNRSRRNLHIHYRNSNNKQGYIIEKEQTLLIPYFGKAAPFQKLGMNTFLEKEFYYPIVFCSDFFKDAFFNISNKKSFQKT